MFLGLRTSIYSWFHPTIDALFGRNIPFDLRWRLLAYQPINILSLLIIKTPWIFTKPWTEEFIQISPSRHLRILIFKSATNAGASGKLRPLHINAHGGAFMGGCPEMDASFCNKLADETGAVVFSISYRFSPRYPWPAAIDDVDATFEYLLQHAAAKYGANPELLTISGFSAGGNLVLAAAQGLKGRKVRGSVAYYASIDLRPKPSEKPRPEGFPTKDPLSFMVPLYDSYAASRRSENMENPRLNPIFADLDKLPEHMLFIIPTMDILVHEQLTLLQRLKNEAETKPGNEGRRIEAKYFEGQFHGWDQRKQSVLYYLSKLTNC
jgi:acetyl esterase/lipase